MMTIEERAKINAQKIIDYVCGHIVGEPEYVTNRLIEIANEQKAIDDATYEDIIAEESNISYESGLGKGRRDIIDKACEWLDEYFPTRGSGESTFISIEAVKECFRKAMEK